MFKAVIEASLLKTILNTLECTVDEARWNISADGITIKAVDPANVLMTYLQIPAATFEYFKADSGVIGLDIEKMKDLMSDSADGEKATLELIEDKAQLKIGIGNLKWNFSLIDPTAIRAEPRIPTVDLPTMVEIQGHDFRKIIKSAMKVSDHIVFGVAEECFVATAKDGLQEVEAKIPIADLIAFKDGESRSLFSLDYLDDMSKSSMKVDSVHLEFGIDYPMRMTFKIGSAVGTAPNVEYLMAPRIESPY